MKRSSFIRTGLGATATLVAVGIPVLAAPNPDPLAEWLDRFSGSAEMRGSIMRIESRPGTARLGEALESLRGIADGDMHCAGSRIRGQIGGQRFELELKAA